MSAISKKEKYILNCKEELRTMLERVFQRVELENVMGKDGARREYEIAVGELNISLNEFKRIAGLE